MLYGFLGLTDKYMSKRNGVTGLLYALVPTAVEKARDGMETWRRHEPGWMD
jgi:hypothetical protein